MWRRFEMIAGKTSYGCIIFVWILGIWFAYNGGDTTPMWAAFIVFFVLLAIERLFERLHFCIEASLAIMDEKHRNQKSLLNEIRLLCILINNEKGKKA
jgi:hypothetical protein